MDEDAIAGPRAVGVGARGPVGFFQEQLLEAPRPTPQPRHSSALQYWTRGSLTVPAFVDIFAHVP